MTRPPTLTFPALFALPWEPLTPCRPCNAEIGNSSPFQQKPKSSDIGLPVTAADRPSVPVAYPPGSGNHSPEKFLNVLKTFENLSFLCIIGNESVSKIIINDTIIFFS